MKRVLVIDGGGAKGFIPLQSLLAIEDRTGKRCSEIFDLVLGTSVGAILGGLCASGRLPALTISALMHETCPRMFSRRMWPLLPKYSRKPFREAWDECIGSEMKLGECATELVVTAVNECDGMPHYFKSDDPEDGALPLRDVIEYSFAAPLYFGGIRDEARHAVWLDGGSGVDNCPVLEAVYEAVSRWMMAGEPVHMLSLGCGYHNPAITYKRAASWWGRNVREVGLYMSPDDGGLARRQSVRTRVDLVQRLDQAIEGFTFQRIDAEIPAEFDQMDAVKHIPDYCEIGNRLAAEIDFGRLT